MAAASQTGGCRRGAIRPEALAEPFHVSCSRCAVGRGETGAAVPALVGFAADTLALSHAAPRSFENDPVTRSFCCSCGAFVKHQTVRDDADLRSPAIDVTTAEARELPDQARQAIEEIEYPNPNEEDCRTSAICLTIPKTRRDRLP